MGNKVGVNGGLMNESSDVGGSDVHSWTHKSEWGGGVATLGEDAGNRSGKRFDVAKPGWACSVMNGRTALAVLLVVRPKCD